ncbi:MAG: transcription elongation factor GreA [Anaerolineae bacterium]|nr:transcription elongation factor GreA [Anaerolineae bacterium]
MLDKKTFLTPEGHQKLLEELEYLTTVRRAEVAKVIHEAKMDGDVMENAGYDEARRQQAFLEGRILTLQAMLENVEIIQANGNSDVVDLGSRVTVAEDGFEPETYTIVGSAEADPASGRISNASPLGKALLAHKVGDLVSFSTPNGAVEVKIVAIE